MGSINQKSDFERAEAESAESQGRLANLEHETVVGSDLCPACSESQINEFRKLKAVTQEWMISHPTQPYMKRTSRDIIQSQQSCWFCRLIHRFCARWLPGEIFTKWCKEDISVAFHTSDSIWGNHFLGFSTPEEAQVTFQVIVRSLDHGYYQFYVTYYPKYNPPSRMIDRTVASMISEEAYLQKIGQWISNCTSTHPRCTISADPMSSLKSGIDLIDVRTREIVTVATQCKYVALSFVWGNKPLRRHWPNEKSSDELGGIISAARKARVLPADLPSTIEDAVLITKSLGGTYLWIDCFCIEQDDPELRKLAIENMDIIYKGAFVTICVLDSGDVFGSIPGIRVPHHGRVRASTDTESGWYVATKDENLASLLGNCSWGSRGWTFQEGAMSTRRLCFHQRGVFLLCQEELYYDVMCFDKSDGRVRNAFDSGRDYGLAFGMNLGVSSWDFEVYSRIATAYTRRKLSFESDALNAVTGALQTISRKTDIRFIAAIPEQDLLNGLFWLHPRPHSLNGPFVEMSEVYDNKAHRRSQFPSWSWLGWQAPAKYLYWLKPFETPTSAEIKAERSEVFSLCDNGQILYKGAIRMEEYAIASIELSPLPEQKPLLMLETQSASFPVARMAGSENYREKNGDHWVLLDTHGQQIIIENVENFHNDILIFFYTDFSMMKAKCSVNLHHCVSDRLSQEGVHSLEFVMLQHWIPTHRNELVKVHPASYSGRTYDMSTLVERVWVMAIAPSKDGFVERIGLTWIPGQQWREACPKDVAVRVA